MPFSPLLTEFIENNGLQSKLKAISKLPKFEQKLELESLFEQVFPDKDFLNKLLLEKYDPTKTKICSYCHIKQCEGICGGLEFKQDYDSKILQIENVLCGKIDKVNDFVKNKIGQAVVIENYELAALWRDRLKTIENTIEDQKIILPQPQDIDLVTLAVQQTPEGLQIGSVFVQNIRSGRMINVSNFLLSGTEDDSYSDLESNDNSTQESVSDPILEEVKSLTISVDSATLDNSGQVLESNSTSTKLEDLEMSEIFEGVDTSKPVVSENQRKMVNSFLQRFFSNYYANKTDNPKVLLQAVIVENN